MKNEIKRRENEPNDLEQVEDAIFYIIDTIAKRDAKNKWIVSLMKKKEAREAWHPNTLGFRLDPLEPIQSAGADSDDEGIPRVTDLDFNENMIISATGHMVATLMPWNLMDIHEKERERRKYYIYFCLSEYNLFICALQSARSNKHVLLQNWLSAINLSHKS